MTVSLVLAETVAMEQDGGGALGGGGGAVFCYRGHIYSLLFRRVSVMKAG